MAKKMDGTELDTTSTAEANGHPPVRRYSSRREEIPYEIEGEDGVVQQYVLREPESPARDAYMTQLAAKMRLDKMGRPVGLKDFTNFQADLIGKCLYKQPENTLVPVAQVQKLPPHVQTDLFKEAQRMAGLTAGAQDEEGNA
jgi:hypothetical protein